MKKLTKFKFLFILAFTIPVSVEGMSLINSSECNNEIEIVECK